MTGARRWCEQATGAARPSRAGPTCGAPSTAAAFLGLAVGSLLRSTAAAVVALTGVLFLLPVLVGLLPTASAVLPWLPSQAGQAVLQLGDPPTSLSPGLGLVVLTGDVTALVLAALVVADRRR